MKSLLLILLCAGSCLADDAAGASALGELFDKGEYQEAIEASRLAYEQGDKETSLYVAAASSSLLGEYRDAVGFCRKYLDENPEGKYLVEIAYYYGVSLARMGYRERADFLLRQLVDSAEGRYKYLSMYELGLLELRAGNYTEAKNYGEQLVANELDAEQEVQAQLLLGQVLESTGDREAAEKCYLSAYRIAEANELSSSQEECLFYLVAFYGREKVMGEPNLEMAKALPHYEIFEKSFPESEYRAQVLMASLPALNEAGRVGEAIEKLEMVVQEALIAGVEAGVQEAAKALLWARMDQGEEISKIREELLAESSESSFFYQAVMRSALADIYEIGADQAHLSWGRQMKFRTLARGLRCGLLLSTDNESFPSFVQLELGELSLESEGAATDAEGYFERASDSKVEEQKLWAKLGYARALAQKSDEQLDQALSILRDLEIRGEGNVELLDDVLIEQLRVLDQLSQWEELEQKSQFYLMQNRLKQHRNQAHYYLAKSYDKQGQVEDAIAKYTHIFTAATGDLAVSAPAVERLTQLTWVRNMPAQGGQLADRQIAYQLANRYFSLIEDAPEWRKELPEVGSHLVAIRKNISQWEQSGEVETVDEILDQMRKGERPIIRK
ncbi:tetratricopeptide repeat protein [Rubritalea spongiae]|uniref:Tetratricopeptide repeat protein n=1 Tax=Rubritalea spongiae TaxID=430797 RepID=A0ABW5E3M4_9BACT